MIAEAGLTVSRRGAIKLLGGSLMAGLIPLWTDGQGGERAAADSFKLPLQGRVLLTSGHLQPYSERSGQPAGTHHIGVDLNIGEGDDDLGFPVYLIAAGICLHASYSQACGLGNIAIFEHRLAQGDRVYSRYAHLDQLAVYPGLMLAAGDTIATVGRSGCQGSSHLHLDVANELAWRESLSQDPRWYPQGAPLWWLKKRFVDPIRLLLPGLEANTIHGAL